MAGSELMGLPRPGALEFAGTVGSGLPIAKLVGLTALLQTVEQPVSPFTGPLPSEITRQARWVRPVFAAEMTYLERTQTGRAGCSRRQGSGSGAGRAAAARRPPGGFARHGSGACLSPPQGRWRQPCPGRRHQFPGASARRAG